MGKVKQCLGPLWYNRFMDKGGKISQDLGVTLANDRPKFMTAAKGHYLFIDVTARTWLAVDEVAIRAISTDKVD